MKYISLFVLGFVIGYTLISASFVLAKGVCEQVDDQTWICNGRVIIAEPVYEPLLCEQVDDLTWSCN